MGRSSATADGPRDVYVSRNLVNYCTTMRTSCTTNPQQIDRWSQSITVDGRVVNRHDTSIVASVVNKLGRR